MDNKFISPRKRLAMGESIGTDFGVDNLNSPAAGGPAQGGKYLGDHERAARPPIDGNQANPDHGNFDA